MTGKRKEALTSVRIDWCHQIDPPCPFRVGDEQNCGIRRRLRLFRQRKTKLEEAERLLTIAETDSKRFVRICEEGIFESKS